MNFEILISTMHKDTNQVSEMLASMNISCDAVVIVQGDFEGTDELELENGKAKIFYTKERGLSKSRNTALKVCATKYGYIMDDDVKVDLDAIKKLVGFMEQENVDVATCQYQFKSGNSPRSYSNTMFTHNFLSSARVASIEICLNTQSLKEKNISFDERFGLGTNLPSGEEYILLTDCLKKDLTVKYYPITTGIHPDITSGMDFYSSYPKTLAKREMFKRIFGWKSFVFIFAFWLKKLPTVVKEGYTIPFTKTFIFGVK